MKLYHFTAERFLPSIQREGLTHGRMLITIDPPRLVSGWQWLTVNPSFAQEWAEGTGRLPYRRDEVRITVKVPKAYRAHLRPWTQCRFLCPQVADDLSAYGDPENWWLYDGTIPPGWLHAVHRNPSRIPPQPPTGCDGAGSR